MQSNDDRPPPQEAFNNLLVRWLCWAEAIVRVDDTEMRDLDALINSLRPMHRVALILQARNFRATVWTLPRVAPEDIERAQAELMGLLEPDRARWYGPRVVKLNENGRRIGESNPRAELTDHEVALLLELRAEVKEDGTPKHSYGWLADKFEIPKSTVQDICNGRRRAQDVAKVKVE